MRKLSGWIAEQLIFLDESTINERTAHRNMTGYLSDELSSNNTVSNALNNDLFSLYILLIDSLFGRFGRLFMIHSMLNYSKNSSKTKFITSINYQGLSSLELSSLFPDILLY
jgi:hypothetical protein